MATPEEHLKKTSEKLMAFLRSAALFIVLICVIIASFSISYVLGKRILVPGKNLGEANSSWMIKGASPEAALREFEKKVAKEKLTPPLKKVATPEATKKVLDLASAKGVFKFSFPKLFPSPQSLPTTTLKTILPPALLTPEVKAQAASKPVVKAEAATVTKGKTTVAGAKHYHKVQAGFYSTLKAANAFAKQLNTAGFPTYVKKVKHGYRVQVGALAKKTEAQTLQKSLSSKGFKSVIIYE